MKPVLGCIGDDFTGSTDLAGMLVRAGLRTVQMIGVPTTPPPPDVDAIVVALKSRTTPPHEAIAESLAALDWLRAAGCEQFYFKYCSTFDSTDRGNIGPVTDALMTALRTSFTIACPAFPENKRTIFKGYLFAGDVLLNESGMQHHPLTPMTDPNLVRVLQRQTTRKVGLVSYDAVAAGASAVQRRFAELQRQGVEIAIVDATSNQDLLHVGAACAELPLVTAGSGLALGLVPNFRVGIPQRETDAAAALPRVEGSSAVVAGSCSVATQGQVALALEKGQPGFRVDPTRLAAGEDVVGAALAWAKPLLRDGPVLVYATASPDVVRSVQARLGVEQAGQLVERALASIARGLVELGVRRLVVAGGETAGAVVGALGVTGLRIGTQIDPGVPWTASLGDQPIALALKSGNFGTPDFFLKAWGALR
jgi:3-dehydrotetronate 4-kinase